MYSLLKAQYLTNTANNAPDIAGTRSLYHNMYSLLMAQYPANTANNAPDIAGP